MSTQPPTSTVLSFVFVPLYKYVYLLDIFISRAVPKFVPNNRNNIFTYLFVKLSAQMGRKLIRFAKLLYLSRMKERMEKLSSILTRN